MPRTVCVVCGKPGKRVCFSCKKSSKFKSRKWNGRR